MKKFGVVLVLVSGILLFLTGCTKNPGEPGSSSSSLPSGYGLLQVAANQNNLQPSASITWGSIVSYQYTIKGTGMANIVTNGGTSISIAVPAGKNRIVVAEARDAGGTLLPGAKFYSYGDIVSGITTGIDVNWSTIPAGAVLEAMLALSIDLSTVNPVVLQSNVNNLNTNQKQLVNAASNATYYQSTSTFLSPLAQYTPATIQGRLMDSTGTNYLGSGNLIKARDTLSPATVSYLNGYYTNTNIVPGTRTVQVYDNIGNLIGSTNITLTSGQTLALNIATSVLSGQPGTGGINITNLGPVLLANAGPDFNAYTGYASSLIGTNSVGNIVTFKWAQMSGPELLTIVNSNSNIASFTPTVRGTNNFSLQVNDGSDIMATNVRAFVYAVDKLSQGFENGTVGTLEPAWWTYTNTSPGSNFTSYVTNASVAYGTKSHYLSGICSSGYMIGGMGTSVDSILAPYSGAYAPVNLSSYAKVRVFIDCLDNPSALTNQLALTFIDASNVCATWVSHNYPPSYTGWTGDGWYEVNLVWSNMVQSNATASQFNKNTSEGNQSLSFDWTKVVQFKFALGATGTGAGRGSYIVDELMLIKK